LFPAVKRVTDMEKNNETILVTQSSMPPIEEYVEAIQSIWKSKWLTNMGKLHEELTARLQKEFEAEHFLLFSNGHMALELALQSLGLQGEVITTPFTFLSTTLAIIRNGLTPVFCDIDPVRLTIDPDKIEALITEKTCAIVGVHIYGIPCETRAIEAVAAKHGLRVIYDAAHAFHVRYLGQNIANYGDISMFSFHATKVYHTIEGGGVVCRDFKVYDRLSRLRNFGFFLGAEDGDQFGVNAKMSEFHAAMGLCNLQHIQQEIHRRKKVSMHYDMRLGKVNGLQLFPNINGLERNYAYYPVIFHDTAPKNRDEAYDSLQKYGITARKYFYPLTSRFSCFKDILQPEKTPVAQDISDRILCLPLYAALPIEAVNRICDILLN